VIGIGVGGLRLDKQPAHYYQDYEIRQCIGRVDIKGHVAYHLRDMEILLNFIKCNQLCDTNSDVQIVKVPSNVQCKICCDSFSGSEWIEEVHRKWKADAKCVLDSSFGLELSDAESYTRASKRKHTEENARTRKIVIDIGPELGLKLSEKALRLLEFYTKCNNVEHLQKIPRDHPALVQTVYQMGKRSRLDLRVISIPIDVEWFIGSKYGTEYIVESFRMWPAPSEDAMEGKFLFAQYVNTSHRLISNQLSRFEWELMVEGLDKDKRFDNITELLQQKW